MKPILIPAVVFSITSASVCAAEPQLTHMLFFTLAEDTRVNRKTLIATCHSYPDGHERMVYFSACSLADDLRKEVNDTGFHISLHLVFASQKQHDVYQKHPRRLKFIQENKHL